MERWLPVAGYEGLYEVSDHGRVRCLPRYRVRGGIMTPSSAGKGYRKVTLCDKERKEHRYVHEMVLTAFVGPRPDGQEAAHGNGKRDDNRLSNLRWDTRSGNHADKRAHGTMCEGEKSPASKLSAADVIQIRSQTGTLKEIGSRFGVGPMQILRIKNRQNWGSVE